MSIANEKRRVLVTGGAGFIGSHAAETLRGLGWHVEVLDNFSTGDAHNVADGPPLHYADIRSDEDIGRLFAQSRFDAVIHCAAQTAVERSMIEPELDWQINVGGTRRLVLAAKADGVRRFVFLSSGGAIYGETSQPADETTLPAPRSYYGLHKFAAEQVLRAEGISHAVLRPSNVYGTRQRSDAEGGVIAIFAERLLAGEPLLLHGDGRQVRDFVHVSDVVGAIVAALEYEEDVVWNVASGRATRIIDIVSTLARTAGVEPEIRFGPRRAGDVEQSLLTPARLLETGRWGPPLSLAEGLRRLVEAQRAQRVPSLQ